MVNMASGIARGRDLSPATTTAAAAAVAAAATARKHGDLSHTGLVSKRFYLNFNIGYAFETKKPADQCQMTLSRAQM